MNFDIKTLLPFLTAAAGGGAGWYFLGKQKESGVETWAVAVGGALVGYVAGQFIRSKLGPVAQPQIAASVQPPMAQAQGQGEYVDFDRPVQKRLPAARPLPPPNKASYMPPTRAEAESSVRAAGVSDAAVLDSMGSMEGTGEDGMGSYALDVDVDSIDVEELVRESGLRGSN